MAKSKALDVYRGRVTEEFILQQVDYHYDEDTFRDIKERQTEGDRLYRGDLVGIFADETALPATPYVENKFKNALHDISRLSAEGRGAVKAVARGDRDKDLFAAQVYESINEGYWVFNKMPRSERQLYLDLAGMGMMSIAAFYNDSLPYPQASVLNPRFCYPDVRGGKLHSMLTVEEVKERILAAQHPEFDLDTSGDNAATVLFVCYYDADEVAEAVVTHDEGNGRAKIVNRWVHELEVIPVAFEQLDTYDRGLHGLFEQLKGPLMVRNKVIRFMVDYLESIAHAPIQALNILNADEEPGPTTIYQHDPTAERSLIGRVEPAAPANTVFGLLTYMADQEEKESIQPPSRAGDVSQSIASGSFVDRTQGQLTSVVKELQDKMASLREQFNEICNRMEERWMDTSKPLLRPVGNKKSYTPSKDIDGWYQHEVKFGAGAGLDRLNADTRVLNHLAARLISREEARAEIDYLDDSASSQDKIDREQLADALLQRLVRDPTTPMSVIAKTWLVMKQEGLSLDEALEQTVPEMLAAEQMAAGAQAPPGMAEDMGEPEGPVAGQPVAAEELQQVQLQGPPIAQLFPGRNFR